MEKSENYGLYLPSSDADDIADISQISENFRIIDSEMKPEDTFNSESQKPQSGIAVGEAIDIVRDNLSAKGKNYIGETETLLYGSTNKIVTLKSGEKRIATTGDVVRVDWHRLDFNGDGIVDDVDNSLLRQAISGLIEFDTKYDLNGNGIIDATDLTTFKNYKSNGFIVEWNGEAWDFYQPYTELTYNPKSLKPQSGVATEEAIERAKKEVPKIYSGTEISTKDPNLSAFIMATEGSDSEFLAVKVGDLYVNTDENNLYYCVDVTLTGFPKTSFSSWMRTERVGVETVGEIFNDYNNNQAINYYSHAENYSNIAGVMGFDITNFELSDLIAYITLNSVEGISVGDAISVQLYSDVNGSKYVKYYLNKGTVTAINDLTLTVTMTDTIPYPYAGSDGESLLWLPQKPTVGTKKLFAYQHAEGARCIANGESAHTEGCDNIADGKYSHAEGRDNFAGHACHAEGKNNIANGEQTHVEGTANTGDGYGVHVEGDNNKGTGSSSHIEGSYNIVTSKDGHVEGFENNVSGVAAHGEGYRTRAEADYSHVEGSGGKGIGESSHTEGIGTISVGKAAHSEGINTDPNYYTENAYGEASHTEGTNNKAYAKNSHVGGNKNIAGVKDSPDTAQNAFVHGSDLSATKYRNQVVFGNSNLEEDNAIFTIGNGYWGNLGDGKSGQIRKNAVVVKQTNPNCVEWTAPKAYMEVESQGTTPKSVVIKSTFEKLLVAIMNATSIEALRKEAKDLLTELAG